MFSRLHTFIGGTHIDAAKNLTAELPIEAIPAPEKVVLPLSMHIGAPAKPLVPVSYTHLTLPTILRV